MTELDGQEYEEPSLEYHAPRSVDEALALLAEYGEDAKILAGGQSLLVLLRNGLIAPAALIGLQRVAGLQTIEPADEGGVTIGAMVTQQMIERDPLVLARYPVLAEAAGLIASPQIRRRGTIGGNLCHADPTADPPPVLIALAAEVEIASAAGRRRLPVESLFRDFMEPALEPDELLIAVHLPPPPAGAAYFKHRSRGVDTALVGVAVALWLDPGSVCTDVRIGLAGSGTTPLRAVQAEGSLRGAAVTRDRIAEAARLAAAEADPFSDTEASEAYRREMIEVFVRRAAFKAWQRATTGGDDRQ